VFLEDVLVVEQRVGELFAEDIGLQVVLDALLDDGASQKRVDVRAHARPFHQALVHQVLQVERVLPGQRRVLVVADGKA
jgi:hypothetical protein